MGTSTVLELLGLPSTLEILVAINILSVVYLLWYAWYLFIANKGDPGALGLTLAVMAFFDLMGAGADLYEDWQDDQRRNSAAQQNDAQTQ